MSPVTSSAEGQTPARPDETEMQVMMENREAFEASLTETQKSTYEELFGMGSGRGFLDSEEMKAAKEELEAKISAFVETLGESQKAAYDEISELMWQGR